MMKTTAINKLKKMMANRVKMMRVKIKLMMYNFHLVIKRKSKTKVRDNKMKTIKMISKGTK